MPRKLPRDYKKEYAETKAKKPNAYAAKPVTKKIKAPKESAFISTKPKTGKQTKLK